MHTNVGCTEVSALWSEYIECQLFSDKQQCTACNDVGLCVCGGGGEMGEWAGGSVGWM